MNLMHQHRFDNGLWLVGEEVAGAQSLAMSMLLPAGVAAEPADQQGVAPLLAEMICRGAGELDARQHSDALDMLGVQRDTSAQTRHLSLSATMIGTKLPQALPLLLDMVRRPMLAEAALEPSRDLALQAIDALEDEPQSKVFIELRRRHYPPPFDRSSLGQREHLERITLEQVRTYHQRTFVPDGTVLGVAGRFDWAAVKELVGRLLGDWRGAQPDRQSTAGPAGGYTHLTAQSTQVHIGVAYDAVPETDPRSMLQKTAVSVLSGGMSGRLFTEVREKRGLCYSVGARYGGDKQRGAVLCYAGTTAPRAQETLDVLAKELRRLADGANEGEFHRAVVGMKSGLVMQGESTRARAGSIAADQYMYGRPRSLDELTRLVDVVTLGKLNEFVTAHRPGAMTVVTIGPEALKVGK
ncbi:MAG: pitrilysin family protein [Phycisphaeraceae bacterium]